VSLGDSYSSGVGTRVYYNDGSNCSRSPDAYAPQIASQRGYALSFQACSGAKTTDVNTNQLGPLNGTTNLVTITIGGNDAGFSNVIVDCAAWYFPCDSAIDNANSFIQNQLPGLLDTTYNDIRTRATHAHVVPRNLFLPHEVCSSSEWLNGQSNPLSESYHPNISGYKDFTSQIEGVLP
jgi:lysophospholipase L1-like esterase